MPALSQAHSLTSLNWRYISTAFSWLCSVALKSVWPGEFAPAGGIAKAYVLLPLTCSLSPDTPVSKKNAPSHGLCLLVKVGFHVFIIIFILSRYCGLLGRRHASGIHVSTMLAKPPQGEGDPQQPECGTFYDYCNDHERYLLCAVVLLVPWPQPQSFHLASKTSASQ